MADFFLKLDGIEGESADDKHKGEIEIESFSWGLSNSGSAVQGGGAGGGASRPVFQDFSFAARIGKHTPLLWVASAAGQVIPNAVLTARKAGEKPVEYLTVKLSDVLVSSYSGAGAEGADVPMDSFSLNFSKISYDYRFQLADGSQSAPVHGGWDLQRNIKA